MYSKPTTLWMSTILTLSHRASAFDRGTCLQSIQWMLGNGTLSRDSPVFYRDNHLSPPYNGANNMTLTLAGCETICGSEQSWYHDIGPRFNAWVVPVLLLIINVGVSPPGKRNFLEFLHLLGDPIDSLWSLIHKIDAWDRCYARAKQYRKLCGSCQLVVATVFAGYEETQGPRVTSRDARLDELVKNLRFIDHFNDWRRTAVRLADSRTNELARTVLAVILYIYQLVNNFVPDVGGAPSSPPGNRIATAVLLSCFVPAILLTNAVGTFASHRNAYAAMNDLAMRTTGHTLPVAPQYSLLLPKIPRLAQVSASDYYNALAWSGGVYMYRPWKPDYITKTRNPLLHALALLSVAATPVLIGFVGGSLLLWWQTPRGFNCRHIWMIIISLLWIVSPIITLLTYNRKLTVGKYHWRFVLIKDACIALPSFLIFFLSTAGMFNSCWCWSGPWRYPGTGRVVLPVAYYDSDGTITYPTILGTALFLQLVVVASVVFTWRRAFRLLRWKEGTLQREFDHMLTGTTQCMCIANLQDGMNCGSKSVVDLLTSEANPPKEKMSSIAVVTI